jgi:hypothetical protein
MYVTQNHDMYFATFRNGKYSIYRVAKNLSDLINQSLIEDTSKQKTYKLQHLLTYDTSIINSSDSIYNLWVKSSTNTKAPLASLSAGKNLLIQNKKNKAGNIRVKSDARLMMLHKNNLYTCLEG